MGILGINDWSDRKDEIKKAPHIVSEGLFSGTPEKIRTSNRLIRSQVLYPVELRVHFSKNLKIICRLEKVEKPQI